MIMFIEYQPIVFNRLYGGLNYQENEYDSYGIINNAFVTFKAILYCIKFNI